MPIRTGGSTLVGYLETAVPSGHSADANVIGEKGNTLDERCRILCRQAAKEQDRRNT